MKSLRVKGMLIGRRVAGIRSSGLTQVSAGFALTEVCGSLVVAGIVLGLLTMTVVSFGRSTDYFIAHHQAQLAAETYLERLRADVDPQGANPSVRYEVERQPGQGPWVGLTRLTVTAILPDCHRRPVRHSVTTYLPEARP